jgi:predicted Ser/Thr protein kinase
VDIYDTTDGSWNTATLSQARAYLAATSVGHLVLFAGGCSNVDCPSGAPNVVDIYNATSNTWTTTTLSQARGRLAATSVANRYALFAGGWNVAGSFSNVVDIFDSVSGMWNTTTLSQARENLAATSLRGLAFFGGGDDNNQPFGNVDIFDFSATLTWRGEQLSQPRSQLAASSTGNIVAFAGGSYYSGGASSAYYATVDMFNVTSGTWFTMSLSQPRSQLAAASVSGLILFGGGTNGTQDFSTVDIFSLPMSQFVPPPTSPQAPTSPLGPAQTPMSSSTPYFPTTNSTSFTTSVPVVATPSLMAPTSLIAPAPLQTNATDTNSSSITEGVGVGIGLGITAMLIALGIVLFTIFYIKRKKQTKKNAEFIMTPSSTPALQPVNLNVRSNSVTSSHMSIGSDYQSANVSQSSIVTMKFKYSQIPFKDIVLEQMIGDGSYGKVYLAKWNSAHVAVKFCKGKGQLDNFLREINVMIELPPHPNVVQLFGVSLDCPQPVLIMEYCAGGSLDKLLYDSNVKLSDDQKMRLIQGIAAGMYHLHTYNIVHRDLAARNILVTDGGNPKISDFGMSRILERVDEGKTNSSVGPVCWMAPESIATRNYSKKSDVWSFGIVVYEIVSQCEPHKDCNVLEVALQIRDKGLTPAIPGNCLPLFSQIMQMCWQKNPDERPTFATIRQILDNSEKSDISIAVG